MKRLIVTVALVTVGALTYTSCTAVTPSSGPDPVPVAVAAPAVVALPAPTVATTTQPSTTTTTIPWEREPFALTVSHPPLDDIPDLEFDVAVGAEGPMVSMLQEHLVEARLYRGALDGENGPWTQQATMALHKVMDADRSWSWEHEDWGVLEGFSDVLAERIPDRPDEPNRVEIDLTRQVLYLVLEGEVAAVIPVSSGNGDQFVNSRGNTVRAKTPQGDFTIQRHIEGLHRSYLGSMWSPWYFRGGYAIHGSGSVPTQPASHGCVRVPKWEAEYLDTVLEIGWPVHIWD
ncbi:MAG: L,D-transpeptidase [Acidimicrobiia bacterium]|nr:L,D-transpeptidase [Acidimicrobiia bacterium]